jgi:undecaprenyl diphosphate synthase
MENQLPRHIAIIMDGNGRWAQKRGLPRVFGHRAGTDAARRVVRACGDLGVEVLTLYTFSSENWKRPSFEVNALMGLLVEMVHKEIKELNKNNVRLITTGQTDRLPEKTLQELQWGCKETEKNTGLKLNLAISYGARMEIVEAARSLARQAAAGTLKPEDINEELFSRNLWTAGLPDPELLIRPGGEFRVSNFMLWQIAYAELYVTPTLWPDFNEDELKEAIKNFQSRERRFGEVKS